MTRIPFFSFFFVDGVTFRLCWGKPVCTEIGPYVVGNSFSTTNQQKLSFFSKNQICLRQGGRKRRKSRLELPYLQLPPEEFTTKRFFYFRVHSTTRERIVHISHDTITRNNITVLREKGE